MYYYNEIQHHGIKGQRWGVRRFQNKNGTLTAKGKKRYHGDSYDSLDEKGRIKYHKDQFDDKLKKYQERRSIGKRIVKSQLFSVYGSKAYDSLRMMGASRKVAMGKAIVHSLIPVVGSPIYFNKIRTDYAKQEIEKS